MLTAFSSESDRAVAGWSMLNVLITRSTVLTQVRFAAVMNCQPAIRYDKIPYEIRT